MPSGTRIVSASGVCPDATIARRIEQAFGGHVVPVRSVVVSTTNVSAAAGAADISATKIVAARSPFQRMCGLSPRSRGVRLALAQGEALLANVVAHAHDAGRDRGPRVAASVLHEPLGTAHRRRAVLAFRPETAFSVAPELARLRLFGSSTRDLAPRRAAGQLLAERQSGDPTGLRELEDAGVEARLAAVGARDLDGSLARVHLRPVGDHRRVELL